MNEAQVQAIVDAAVAATMAAAIPVGPEGPAGPAGPPITFARTPAQADTGILNYKSSEGMKIYNAAVAALPTKYSGNTDGTNTKNICKHYGLITLEQIQGHAQIYEVAQGRDAQNASQMYDFLESSLTDEAKAMVLSDFSDYTIITAKGMQICNGPCFLKVIIRNTTVDTRSTVFHIRENLSNLEAKMLEVRYNIDAFNQYVTSQVEQLAARGETSSDLLINVFVAFLAVPDKKFVEYIEEQKDRYDKGEDVSTKKLMQVALIKYKDRKRSDLWQAPSIKEEQILALTAQIDEMHKANKRPKKKGTESKKKARTDTSAEKYAWKLVPPASGEPKSTRRITTSVLTTTTMWEHG